MSSLEDRLRGREPAVARDHVVLAIALFLAATGMIALLLATPAVILLWADPL